MTPPALANLSKLIGLALGLMAVGGAFLLGYALILTIAGRMLDRGKRKKKPNAKP